MISHNWSPMKRLIWLRGSGITGGATYETITGNPVSFSAKAAPLRKLQIAFSPVQSGTGDPSPDNVRPISGWSSLTVYHSGADTSNPQTISISLGQTVYSGTLDVVTGNLTVTGIGGTLNGSESWAIGTGAAWFYLAVGGTYTTGYKKADTSHFKSAYNQENAAWFIYGQMHIRPSESISPSGNTDEGLAEFKEWLAQNNVTWFTELATPQTIQLTPQEVASLAGDNTMWSTANQPITVEYRKN